MLHVLLLAQQRMQFSNKWQGDWPRHVPPPPDQKLSPPTLQPTRSEQQKTMLCKIQQLIMFPHLLLSHFLYLHFPHPPPTEAHTQRTHSQTGHHCRSYLWWSTALCVNISEIMVPATKRMCDLTRRRLQGNRTKIYKTFNPLDWWNDLHLIPTVQRK